MGMKIKTMRAVGLSLAIMLIVLGGVIWWKFTGYSRVTIINIANFNSRLQPMTTAGSDGLEQYSFGGAAWLSAAIDQLRENRPEALVTETGDLVMGSWWRLWSGEPEFKVCAMLRVAAGMLGNHEFNLGLEHLKEAVSRNGSFPLLATNIHFEDPELEGLFEKSLILTAPDGLKVGFLSLVPPRLVTLIRGAGAVRIDPDLKGVAEKTIAELKGQGAEAIVLLSHSSLDEDLALAAQVSGLSLIVTGDAGYGLEPAIRWAPGPNRWRTAVLTSGDSVKTLSAVTVTLHRGKPQPDRSSLETVPVTMSLTPDPVIAEVVSGFENQMDELLNQPIGVFTSAVDARKSHLRTGQAELGNFMTDAMRWRTGADVAVVNAGGIRGDRIYPSGPVSIRTIYEILPFQNEIIIKEMTGKQIHRMLTYSASALIGEDDQYESATRLYPGGFIHYSGLMVTMALGAINNPALVDDEGNLLSPGNRIKYVGVVDGADWTSLNDGDVYTVAMPDFLASGGDKYKFLADITGYDPQIIDADVLIDFFRSLPDGRFHPALDDRLKIEGRSGDR